MTENPGQCDWCDALATQIVVLEEERVPICDFHLWVKRRFERGQPTQFYKAKDGRIFVGKNRNR